MQMLNPELLCQYIRIVAMQGQARLAHSIDIYKAIDQHRRELHDELARQAGVSRDDKELMKILAQLCEMYTEKQAA